MKFLAILSILWNNNEIITVNEMKLCRKQICENAQAYISGNQVKFLNSSAAVYREAVSIMPLEEATFS